MEEQNSVTFPDAGTAHPVISRQRAAGALRDNTQGSPCTERKQVGFKAHWYH